MVKASLAVAVRTLSEILEMKSRTFTFFLSDESLREKGLTAKQVSEQTGIKYGTMLKYSSGERTPGVERAKLIAAVLDMDWWKLIEE